MEYKIKTSSGLGSPGYLDDRAPTADQWRLKPGEHSRVPEGTIVRKTGSENRFVPPYIEIEILSGKYMGVKVWVKSSHVVEVNPPPELPPVGEPGDAGVLQFEWLGEEVIDGKRIIKLRRVK
jgi:hypothetical protein